MNQSRSGVFSPLLDIWANKSQVSEIESLNDEEKMGRGKEMKDFLALTV